MPINNRTSLNITLLPDAKALEEVVVVVGSGTQTKVSITGAVATVTSKDLERVQGGSTVSCSLAGKLPGCRPVQQPGSSIFR